MKWNEPKGYAEYKWYDVGRKAFFRTMMVLALALGLLVCLQVWLWRSDDLAFVIYLIGTFLIIVPVTAAIRSNRICSVEIGDDGDLVFKVRGGKSVARLERYISFSFERWKTNVAEGYELRLHPRKGKSELRIGVPMDADLKQIEKELVEQGVGGNDGWRRRAST